MIVYVIRITETNRGTDDDDKTDDENVTGKRMLI